MTNLEQWTKQLNDQRGKKVVFLSHCLLNENTRYLGGAFETGVIPCVIQECLDQGFGIIQMPCPEQHAWGGVLKRHLIRFFGAKGTLLYQTRNILLPCLLWYTRRIYRRLAKQVAKEAQDYLSSGFTVVGIVGVDGSPSCGVRQTMNVRQSLELIGQLSSEATKEDMNAIVLACLMQGKGLFIEALQEEFDHRHLNVPFFSYNLPAELQGNPNTSIFHRA